MEKKKNCLNYLFVADEWDVSNRVKFNISLINV